MPSITEEVMVEIADNWPAFVYIVLMCISSVVFLRERRAEARILKQASANIQEQIRLRFDHLENLIREGKLNDVSRAAAHREDLQFGHPRGGYRETSLIAGGMTDDFTNHAQRPTHSRDEALIST